MKTSPFLLPKPLGRLVSLLPGYPHSLFFTTFLNAVLAQHVRPADLEPLHGKQVCIRVTDAGVSFRFTLTPTAFVPRSSPAPADLTISASAYDFLMLGLRKEDPDTLFFNRRLVMEGDTELGLFVKNTLDSLELPPLDLAMLHPARVLAGAKDRMFRRGGRALPPAPQQR